MQTPRHLARSRQVVLDELQAHPGTFYQRSDATLVALAAEHRYNVVTLDQALVDLVSMRLINKERVGPRVRYYVADAQRDVEMGDSAGVEQTYRYTVSYSRDEDGYVVASVPALPGCHSQGRTTEEARRNVREAMRGYLASLKHRGEAIPVEAGTEAVEVVA